MIWDAKTQGFLDAADEVLRSIAHLDTELDPALKTENRIKNELRYLSVRLQWAARDRIERANGKLGQND